MENKEIPHLEIPEGGWTLERNEIIWNGPEWYESEGDSMEWHEMKTERENQIKIQ